MQRLLHENEVAKIRKQLSDNALLFACQHIWPKMQEEIVSVKPCPEDIFCEAAWLMDELINADEVTNVKGLIEDLWSKAVSDIMNWTEKSIPLTERHLILSTIFRLVAITFSLHYHSHYCDTLRDVLLEVIEERRQPPKDLPEMRQLETQQERLEGAIISCADLLNEWVNEYIDNPKSWLTYKIDAVLTSQPKDKSGKTEKHNAAQKSDSDYSRYSFLLNVNDKQLENLYVMLSKRDDEGKRFIDGDLMKTNEVDEEILSNVQSIKDENIRNTYINKYLFNQVFSGQETDVRIVWTSNVNQLWYFINTLYNYKIEITRDGKKDVILLLEKGKDGPGIWQMVCSRFLNGKPRKVLDEMTGKKVDTPEPIEFKVKDFYKYSAKNSPRDTSLMDAIINKIAPPRATIDIEAIEEDTKLSKYGIKQPESAEQLGEGFHDTSHKGIYE